VAAWSFSTLIADTITLASGSMVIQYTLIADIIILASGSMVIQYSDS